jgi:N-acetylglucosamine malate deacetylase 1
MNVIVISAHPDDETIGCGGTLLKHKEAGDKIFWLITTKMGNEFSQDRKRSRDKEIETIKEAFAIQEVFVLDYHAMYLSSSSIITMVPQISKIFNKTTPEVVYLINRTDAHSDHKITFEASYAATKSFRAPYIKKVLMYECISETEFGIPIASHVFIPNYFVDITKYFEEKLRLIKVYGEEIGEHPFPRSLENVKALATFRGAITGVKYAESFQLLKYYDK